jgi:hypothetical protein
LRMRAAVGDWQYAIGYQIKLERTQNIRETKRSKGHPALR